MSSIAALSVPPSLDAVWRASELGGLAFRTVPTGHAMLDAALPGGGWPRGQLTEVLQSQAGLHEWRLLLPGLQSCKPAKTGKSAKTAKATKATPSALVLIGCPHLINLSALAVQGIPARSVLWLDVAEPAQRLWAAEQALRCRDVTALLLWAPQVRPEQLRRLQVAAQGAQQQLPLVFVFRPAAAQHEASPAPLRVGLRMAEQGQLAVQVLKRRGPPLEAPVLLAMHGPAALPHHHRALPELPEHPAMPFSPPIPAAGSVLAPVMSAIPSYAVDSPEPLARFIPADQHRAA